MQSVLIVHSQHTRNLARKLARRYREVSFVEVKEPPTEEILKIKNNKDIVIGIGGGSVIDTAKVISRNKRCIAIPTTAAGASMTPYATVWGKEKITIPTKKPILKVMRLACKRLSFKVYQSTLFDALSHAVESFWSRNANQRSKRYAKKAIYLINDFLAKKSKNMNKLIMAGNLAGKAIAETKTNIVHAVSYSITIKYGIDHGTACGLLLPYFIEYMNFKSLPKLFKLNSTEELAELLKNSFAMPIIKKFNCKFIADEAMKYKRINNGPKKLDRTILCKILMNIKNDMIVDYEKCKVKF